MRINMCAAIIAMQTFFLIGAHVRAQQVLVCFASHNITFGKDACLGTLMYDNLSSRVGIGYITSIITPDIEPRTHPWV